ncbi:hypothetical protein HNQ08_004458 [Deinococcus humi]|uniref:Uncharacterized protein n=1 Tax=Deinococcus humi TaxID=662880 RepID=A0A7W8JY04_9DEIO|nr:hypothetical protein [Deinococcus humi]
MEVVQAQLMPEGAQSGLSVNHGQFHTGNRREILDQLRRRRSNLRRRS